MKASSWLPPTIILAAGLGAFGALAWLMQEPPEPDMVWIEGGEFEMGEGTDSEQSGGCAPPHRVRLAGFYMDATEVTNAEYARFVAATGYMTIAERPLNPRDFPGVNLTSLEPGAGVFKPPVGEVVDCKDCLKWWVFQPGYSWRHPEGPGSAWQARANHPVVYIAWDDAVAYAKWANKRLPTEAEWEYAARGGLKSKSYTWGDDSPFEGPPRANIWQGNFPNENTATDGYTGTAPVKSYPPNGYGLYDMAGNAWEWCRDWYRPDTYSTRVKSAPPGQVFSNPMGPEEPLDPHGNRTPVRVQRGGSFLCAENYCQRYRVAWRMHGAPDTGLSHNGFRCVRDKSDSKK